MSTPLLPSRRAVLGGLVAVVASRASTSAARTVALAKPETTPLQGYQFDRVLDHPVHSVALGPKGDVAAIGEAAWLHKAGSKPQAFERLPEPKVPLAGVRVYLGRDHLPRLLGIERRPTASGASDVFAIYRRFRKGTWIPAPKELGSLAEPDAGALEGILGDDDPEIVVKVGKQVLVKRRTGWTPLPPLAGPAAYAIAGGEGWGYCRGQLLRFGKKAVEPVGSRGAFDDARALAAGSPQALWALSSEPSGPPELFAFDGSNWRFEACPVTHPHALAATGPQSLWVGGNQELCHWNGTAWRHVDARAADGRPLLHVLDFAVRSDDEVWVAASSGLWRGVRTANAP